MVLVNPSLASGTQQTACPEHNTARANLQKHVAFLSSDAMEGRLTGSIGEKLATQYVADLFQCLGLEPAGDKGSYFQEFDVSSGVSLGENNSLQIAGQHETIKTLVLDQEWRPLSFSDNRSFGSPELVFAGYGITAPALGNLPAYDSYHDLDVKGKWVLVFRFTPEKSGDEQRRQLSQYSSPRYKAFTAKDHGAKGIIFVSGPNSKVRHELIPLSSDASLSGSGILALSVNDAVLDDVLKNSQGSIHSLQTLQDKLDLGQTDPLPALTGVRISGQINIKQNKKRGRNVLAKLRTSAHAASMIVVSAHADHLGHGELSGSRAVGNEKGLIHSGADDNASGVASVLEAAVRLSAMKADGRFHGNKDIVFAVWSGEESGLLGSAHFVKEFMDKADNKSLRPAVDANINLDMVGRLRKHLVLQGVGSSSSWSGLIGQTRAKRSISVITQQDPYLPTDSTSFYLHGVPALNFFTGSHDEYHTSRDKPETLNYEGMNRISNFLVDMILALEEKPGLMDYRQVAKTGDKPGRGFRVYLGTIPDYASPDIVGVTLSGVTKDSPAEHAGVLPDDVVVELAGKTIHDIYDYTFVLNALRVGEPVTLLVLRGQKKMRLTIVARSRE